MPSGLLKTWPFSSQPTPNVATHVEAHATARADIASEQNTASIYSAARTSMASIYSAAHTSMASIYSALLWPQSTVHLCGLQEVSLLLLYWLRHHHDLRTARLSAAPAHICCTPHLLLTLMGHPAVACRLTTSSKSRTFSVVARVLALPYPGLFHDCTTGNPRLLLTGS